MGSLRRGLLGIGFGTGAFTKEESGSRSIAPPTDGAGDDGGDGGLDGGLDGGSGEVPSGGTSTLPPLVVTDPDDPSLAGLDITEFIPSVSLADPSVFEDVESPEYLALNYILTAEGDSFDTNVEEDRFRLVQMYSLLTLWYSSTNAWVDETGWTLTSDFCGWAGVTCMPAGENDQGEDGDVNEGGDGDVDQGEDGDQGEGGEGDQGDAEGDQGNGQGDQDNGQGRRLQGNTQRMAVVEIDMTENGLTGTLPVDLALLGTLRVLTLSNNNILGPLPQSLFIMSNLEELYIDNNLIESELTDVSGLKSITVFFASENSLSGDVSIFWKLTTLTVLVLDDNSFTGTLDGVSALQNLGKFPIWWYYSFAKTDLTRDPFSLNRPFDYWRQPGIWNLCDRIWRYGQHGSALALQQPVDRKHPC